MEYIKMKFWVKIFVAVCVILVIAFTTWAFFFREKDEVQAYNRTAEVIDYKQSLGIREKLIQLNTMDYVNNDKTNVIGDDTDTKKEILDYRKLCLSQDLIKDYDQLEFSSLFVIDEYVNDILEYYLPYTKADDAKNKPLKNLKSDISDYIDSLKTLNTSLDEVIYYHSLVNNDNASGYSYLRDYYKTFYNEYRSTLKNAGDLILSIVEYIDVSVYSDDMLVDNTIALNDAFARSLIQACYVDSSQFAIFADQTQIILNTIEKYRADGAIFTSSHTEYKFLSAYNNLYNKQKDTLNHVFEQKKEVKAQMADDSDSALSTVPISAQDYVVTVLNVLGF